MAKFDVSTFASQIGKKGLASPNKFRVAFTMPSGMTTPGESFNLMCENVDLAGRNVNSAINIEYGVRREVAYNAPAYDALNITFLCSQDMKEKGILEKWNNHIVKVNAGFDVEYYDNYIGTIKVDVLNKHTLESEYRVDYMEAYPKVINSIPFNHTTLNQTVKVTASFSYAYYITPESRKLALGGSSDPRFDQTNIPPSQRG
jgi:hypothetical protein